MHTDKEDLLRRIQISKDIRFANMHRFNKYISNDQIVIQMINFSIITVSLISLLFSEFFTPFFYRCIGVYVIAMSVFMIILNYESLKKKLEYKMCKLELSAGTLNDLAIRMKTSKDLSEKQLSETYSKYKNTLDLFDCIHEEIDRYYVLAENRNYQKIDENIDEEKSKEHISKWQLKPRNRIIMQLLAPVFFTMILALLFVQGTWFRV